MLGPKPQVGVINGAYRTKGQLEVMHHYQLRADWHRFHSVGASPGTALLFDPIFQLKLPFMLFRISHLKCS